MSYQWFPKRDERWWWPSADVATAIKLGILTALLLAGFAAAISAALAQPGRGYVDAPLPSFDVVRVYRVEPYRYPAPQEAISLTVLETMVSAASLETCERAARARHPDDPGRIICFPVSVLSPLQERERGR